MIVNIKWTLDAWHGIKLYLEINPLTINVPIEIYDGNIN